MCSILGVPHAKLTIGTHTIWIWGNMSWATAFVIVVLVLVLAIVIITACALKHVEKTALPDFEQCARDIERGA